MIEIKSLMHERRAGTIGILVYQSVNDSYEKKARAEKIKYNRTDPGNEKYLLSTWRPSGWTDHS